MAGVRRTPTITPEVGFAQARIDFGQDADVILRKHSLMRAGTATSATGEALDRGGAARRADPFGWIGATLDGSVVVETVAGEGGFGIVYRGWHLVLKRPVAVKCLKVPAGLCTADQEQFLARLHVEATLLQRLFRQTAGIVQALCVGAAVAPNGTWVPYLVMEWLEGETLEQHLAAHRCSGAGPVGIAAAAAMLAPVAEVLAVIHKANVAHLDLKPANLFLERSGAGTRLKVLDFGVARTFAESPRFTVSASGVPRAFTPRYGAPEQFSIQYGALGPWTDVFAIALVLVEVAMGRPALEGNDVMQLYVAAIDEGSRKRLIERIPGANDEAQAVLRRALDVSPRLRFRHMGAFWAALEQALAAGGANQTQPVADEDVSMTVPGDLPRGLFVERAAEGGGSERARAWDSRHRAHRVAAVARAIAMAALAAAILGKTVLQASTLPMPPVGSPVPLAPNSAPFPPDVTPPGLPASAPVPDPPGSAGPAASATPPTAPAGKPGSHPPLRQRTARPHASGAQTHRRKGAAPKPDSRKPAPAGTPASPKGVPELERTRRRVPNYGID